MRVVRSYAEPFDGATLVNDVGAPIDAEHMVAPLTREDPIWVVPLLHFEELAGLCALGDGAVEAEVVVLAPLRDDAILNKAICSSSSITSE